MTVGCLDLQSRAGIMQNLLQTAVLMIIAINFARTLLASGTKVWKSGDSFPHLAITQMILLTLKLEGREGNQGGSAPLRGVGHRGQGGNHGVGNYGWMPGA